MDKASHTGIVDKPAPIQPTVLEIAAKRAAIREGIAAADDGRLIPHDEMRRWLLSWGTDDELPPPQCK
ncbi:MAG TPA: CopG family transcriptional regulator [Inquilinus sp.]|nr:CopG family transcriptional regulator [Inquilinus sp.]